MSEYDSPKKLVKLMLEQFDELNIQVQSSLNDYTVNVK